jgi:hypothetical protein
MVQHLSLDERLAEVRREEPDVWLVSDETETVQVSVDLRGKLETLRLAPSWWQRVPAEELGTVVLRLRQMSAAARSQTISELQGEGFGEPLVHAPDTAGPSAGGSADTPQLRARMEVLLTAFDELALYRRAVNEATTAPAVLTSPSGNASLELVGGSPRRLGIDRMNLQFTPERQLAAEIVDLFARADRWLEEQRTTVLADLPSLAGVVRGAREREHRP